MPGPALHGVRDHAARERRYVIWLAGHPQIRTDQIDAKRHPRSRADR